MDAIIDIYGYKPGLCTRKGIITKWPYDAPQPSQTELDQIIQTYKANTAYIKQREKNYPHIQEQLDDLFHLGYDGWKAKIQAVKDKYPKPE